MSSQHFILFYQMVRWITVVCLSLCAISRGNKELWSGRNPPLEPKNSPNCAQTETSGRISDIKCPLCLQGNSRLLCRPGEKYFFPKDGIQHRCYVYYIRTIGCVSWKHCHSPELCGDNCQQTELVAWLQKRPLRKNTLQMIKLCSTDYRLSS